MDLFFLFCSLPLFTALFTICDWVKVLGGVGTEKIGVAYCFCVTFTCLLTDFFLELLVFSHSLYYVLLRYTGLGFKITFGWEGGEEILCIA